MSVAKRLMPPGLDARKRIWSSRKSVFFSTTVAPLLSVHSVTSTSLCVFSLAIVPGEGASAISGSSDFSSA